jgi:transposase InsO family protein
MKKQVIERCIAKTMRWKDGALLLSMHPKALSRLKRRYHAEGESALIGKKPGPKSWRRPYNKTAEHLEETIERLAINCPQLGPVPLAEKLSDDYGIYCNPATVWRILKRRKVRYTTTYRRWKQEPTLYCLDAPGEELQLDACYPFGKARKVVSFDALDDCSRYAFGHCYTRETTDNAIRFVRILIAHVPFKVSRLRVDNRYGRRFTEYCHRRLGVEVIVNEPYCPEQNGKVERFHRTLKREFFWRHCSWDDSLTLLNYKYGQWLSEYNYYRRHGGFGMQRLTPAQKIAVTLTETMTAQIIAYPQKVTGTLQQYIV